MSLYQFTELKINKSKKKYSLLAPSKYMFMY